MQEWRGRFASSLFWDNSVSSREGDIAIAIGDAGHHDGKCVGSHLRWALVIHSRNPIQAIKDWRLDQASVLLAQGIHTDKAGLACGYSNPAYFVRDFRRRMGRSPKSLMPQH